MSHVHNELGSAIQVKITQLLKNLMTDFKKVNEIMFISLYYFYYFLLFLLFLLLVSLL